VAQAWAEAYGKVNPNVAVAVTGGGSGTGISAMINGTVDLANSSRAMRESELEAARGNGVEPLEHIVGFDALAIFLHPDNPISEISLAQIASIYGEGGTAENWADLGIQVPGCTSGEIVRVSRQNNSGTYAYSGLAYANEHVKMPCVFNAAGEACITPTVDTAVDGSYPIARPLFMYTAGEPQGANKEYLDWIMSDEGQCIIMDKGYAPAQPVTCAP
jgi:phosphate transport system substrate-binding protein